MKETVGLDLGIRKASMIKSTYRKFELAFLKEQQKNISISLLKD